MAWHHPSAASRSAPLPLSRASLPLPPIQMARRRAPALLLLLSLLLLAAAAADPPESERSALLAFLTGTPHERPLNWNASLPTCSWTGIRCSSSASNNSSNATTTVTVTVTVTVTELHLPGIGLVGAVPDGTLAQLRNLQVLSLRDNRLAGPVPPDALRLPRLRGLYLQGNLLSGALPPALAAGALPALEHLALSRNQLSGPVPNNLLDGLPSLRSLMLDANRLSGGLPAGAKRLEAFNASFNDFDGPIPASLARFPPGSFAGNPGLCGEPLVDRPCPAPPGGVPAPPGENNKKKKRRLSGAAVVAIAVVCGAAALLLLLLLLICAVQRRRRQHAEAEGKVTPPTRGLTPSTPSGDFTGGGDYTSSSKDMSAAMAAAGAGGGERGRLVFVGKQGRYSFDLEDLLRASAEVLGKGALGTSYKAVLEDGATVAVKRLRDVAAARREFAACVEAAAAAAEGHRNLVPLRAYYYSKDEKLLVLDFLPAGSLSARLHGSRGTGRTAMDWEARVRAALCAARGVAHLHTAHGLPHGDIKSSNLLLRPDPDAAALSDYCLQQLFPPAPAGPGGGGAGSGYRAPELADARRPTLSSDVYALGVLLLELLTGRSPAHHAGLDGGGGGDGGPLDLPRWVQSVVREEWTAEVFDAELVRAGGAAAAEEEMVALLQVAMACVSTAPDARPGANDVVRMLEEVIGAGHGGRTATDESDGTRAASEEERSRGPTP